MSFENYAQHIIQKYRLAVALAVLKEKPSDLSVQSYIELLKRKINNKNGDFDETICSDDFQIDEYINYSDNIDVTKIGTSLPTNIAENAKNSDISGQVLCEKVNNYENHLSQNLLDGYNIITEDACHHNNNEQSNNNINSDIIIENNTVQNNDTSIAINNDVKQKQENTINLQEKDQNSVTILQNYVINNTTNNKDTVTFKDFSTNTDTLTISTNRITKQSEVDNITGALQHKENEHSSINHVNPKINHKDESNETQTQYCFVLNLNDFNKNADTLRLNAFNNTDNTQNYTHVSQSQTENICIKQILLQPKAKCYNKDKFVNLNKGHFYQDTNNETNMEINESNDIEMTNNQTNISVDENTHKYNNIEMETHNNESYPMQCAQNTELVYNLDLSTQETVHQMQKNKQNENQDHTMKEMNQEVVCDENSRSQAELIPFKVLEELNKVKSYLGRRGERRISQDSSLDSGYKSDSQGRSFKGASQLTCNSVNQSAHCLFDYLMNIPLLAASRGITEDISMALSKLIDRLHEEEKYLAFLDKLLETVDEFLQNLFESDNYEDNSLLRKDDEIQRLLLLNHSRHIQSYTIDKMTGILEKIHEAIAKEDQIYEIDNINQAENACYIFHVLQILLERYVKHRIESSPVDSQNELKKSSITDIWRRKWDPKYREQPKTEGSVRTKCVLVKCGETLNKLVVNCMDGYGLVSFAALQCFNVLQN